MDEHFRQIEGYPGYRVSRDGEVQSRWNRHGRRGSMSDSWLPLKPIRNSLGYGFVNLHADRIKKRCSIHSLVLEAFVGPRPDGLVCCHWDGDPSNNQLSNLRWDTQKANSDDTIRHGRRKFGEQAGSKLKEAEVLEIRRLHGEGVSISELAASHGVSWPAIWQIVQGLKWRHLLPSAEG